MSFTANTILTAAALNDLDIDSLVVDTNVLVVDKTSNEVGVGTASPAAKLHVNAGTVNLGLLVESTDAGAIIGLKDNTTSGTAHVGIRADGDDLKLRAGNSNHVTVASGGQAKFVTGDATAPSVSFNDDSNSGMYLQSSDVLAWSTAGVKRALLYSGGFRVNVNGAASAPSITFESDTDTGFYRNTANQPAIAAGGSACLIGAGTTINTASPSTGSTSGYQYVLRNNTFGTLYRFTSSADVKENITNVTDADSGSWMDALQPVTFINRWLQDGDEPDEDRAFREADVQVGFIADDVLANPATARFAQVEDVDGTLKGVGWKWECVIAAAVAEIKSLRARVADLEAA